MQPERSIATILFTDIVGSTEKASELGDHTWRDLQERHHAIVREELRHWGGREVTEAGDGFMALFENPAQAIVCSHAIRDRVHDLGLEIRCGLHMGEVEHAPDGSAGGIAVHIGARAAGEAGPGEVLVTSTVRDAESGSGFDFEDRGRHALKGVDREWWLYRVTGLPEDAASLAPGAWQRMKHRVGSRRAVAAVVAVVLVAGAGYAIMRSASPGAAVASEIRSLAVLPLENLSGDPDQEYFVDGMTEAMITELSKLGAVRVISRRSVMRYKGGDTPLSEIAEELNVDGIVEGSVVRDGDQVRITAQLIHAGSDTNVWAESYDGDVAGVLVLQSNVARDIAREIEVALTPEAESRLAASSRVNPETYEAYLKGMYHLNKETPEDYEQGMAYLHEAVERNPGDALAYAGLAIGYITIAHSPAAIDVRNKAREAAERALMLDPDLALAHASLAAIKTYFDWDWDEAEREFQRANALDPNLAMNHYHYAWYLALHDRMDEAIEEHKRAQELDPLTPLHTAWLGGLYYMVGRYDDAIAEADKAFDLDETKAVAHFVKGMGYRGKGMYGEAIEAHEAAAAGNPMWKPMLGSTYVVAGRRDEALRILEEIESQEVGPYNALARAILHNALGNLDEAFRWYNYEPHHAWAPWVRVDSLMYGTAVRSDPRFEELMSRMRLPMPRNVEGA